MQKLILNVAEAAELLECTEQSIELAARSRKLPGQKYGKNWVFSARALEEVVYQAGMQHYKARPIPDETDKPTPTPAPGFPYIAPPTQRKAATQSRARPRPDVSAYINQDNLAAKSPPRK